MKRTNKAILANDMGMPIKEENKHLYPKNWEEIRQKILDKCKQKCEECGVQNLVYGWRNNLGQFITEPQEELALKRELGFRIIRIVLTVAHLDHNPRNNLPNNLKALCQRCHFQHDRADNIAKRKASAEKVKEQISLL